MKIFKNIMMILMLFTTGIISAKQTGAAVRKPLVQPSEIITPEVQPQPQLQPSIQPQVQPGKLVQEQVASLAQEPKPVSQEDWNRIVMESTRTGKLPSNINVIKPNLTSDQKMTLLMIEQNMALQKELKKQQFLLRKEQARKGVKPTKGWFSWLWGAEAASIEEYKTMIKGKLDNVERYPTFKAREEALDLGIEFSEPGYDDVRIMKLAQDALKKELVAESAALSPAKQTTQKMINDEITKLRDEFGFDLSEMLPEDLKFNDFAKYLENIVNNTKDFVIKNITNKNAIILLQAIVSEYERVSRIIDILRAAQPVPGAVPMTSAQPSAGTTPTGKPAGQ